MSKLYPFSYIRKKIVKSEQAVVPVQCKALQYGLGCFTGIRGHWNKNHKNLYLFRFKDHYQRLKEAARILDMRFNYTYPKFEELIFKLIKKNGAKEDMYIRPTLYAASTKLTPRFGNPDDDLAIYMISLKDYFNTTSGLDVCISTWRRFDDDMMSTKAKITGAYASSALAKTEALQNGYAEAIFLNRDGMVCEASGANVFGIKDNVVYTPPLNSNNLNGITRRSAIELFENEIGIEVREEDFDRSTLYAFDELFFTGTAAKVAYIQSVDRKTIGTGNMGKYTSKIKDLFDQISTGEMPRYSKWLTSVY